jgi:hypothetical protein
MASILNFIFGKTPAVKDSTPAVEDSILNSDCKKPASAKSILLLSLLLLLLL